VRLANNAVQIKKGAAGVLSHSYLGFQSMTLRLLIICVYARSRKRTESQSCVEATPNSSDSNVAITRLNWPIID
jgi:hypothetical protein